MQSVDERVLVGVVVPAACDRSPDPLPQDLEGLRPHGGSPVSPLLLRDDTEVGKKNKPTRPRGADAVGLAVAEHDGRSAVSRRWPDDPLRSHLLARLAGQLGHCSPGPPAGRLLSHHALRGGLLLRGSGAR